MFVVDCEEFCGSRVFADLKGDDRDEVGAWRRALG